jgi:hypothetical protein
MPDEEGDRAANREQRLIDWSNADVRAPLADDDMLAVSTHAELAALSGRAPRDGVPAPVTFRTEHLLGVVVNWPSVGLTDDFCARCWSVRRIPTHGRLTPCGD